MSGSGEDVASRIAALEARVAALEQAGHPPPPVASSGEKSRSIREFLNERRPRTSVDRALAIAYHLEKSAGMASVNLEDLTAGFSQAKEPLPANPSDLLYQNVRRGYLMDAAEKKGGARAWTLTNTGERFVESGFTKPGEAPR